MKLSFLPSFWHDYNKLPGQIKNICDETLVRIKNEPRHSSLRIKKMQGTVNIWEGRINRQYRLTFIIERNEIIFRRVGTHDILRRP